MILRRKKRYMSSGGWEKYSQNQKELFRGIQGGREGDVRLKRSDGTALTNGSLFVDWILDRFEVVQK